VAVRGLAGEDNAPSLAFLSDPLQGCRLTTVMALDGRAGVVVAEHESLDVMRIDLQTPIINGTIRLASKGERFIASALRAR
jgi:CheY-like chemotaxis protein